MQYKREEYPRPQFRRDEWTTLNGEWEFTFDDKREGIKSGLQNGNVALDMKINVPFSYQYPASGIGDKSMHDVVWYRRKFEATRNKRALLCFNAVDYVADVWVNGKHVITHRGGFSPFKVDITDCLEMSENVLVVRCENTAATDRPRGKQCWKNEPFSCFYTPNSGIWQSVWIEYFGNDCIENYRLESDIDNRLLLGEIDTLYGKADSAEVTIYFKDKLLSKSNFSLNGRHNLFTVNLGNVEPFAFGDLLWKLDRPNLLSVDFKLFCDGYEQDCAHTRIGLRKISVDTHGKIYLNEEPLFQRLVLDQGYWNESGLTSPSVQALRKDIELAKAMGFNGARKHQKFEDPYYYYYADEIGFLTWCEMPSAYSYCAKMIESVINEWQAILTEARNQTSNICYVPLNESWGVDGIKTNFAQQNFARSLYYLTKAIDGSRLISTNDGFENIEESDILSIHDYCIKRADEFSVKYKIGQYDGMHPQGWALFANGHKYKGQPVLLTEFGGIAFEREQDGNAWGYGDGVKDCKEFINRISELINGILTTEFQGYCYTQLTDVQQEVNGLLNSEHEPKLDLEKLKTIFGKNKNPD